MLPLFYRVTVWNNLGQTIAANGVQVKCRRWKITDGAYDEETSEATLLDSSSLTQNSYESGTKQSNDDAGTGWYGGHFVMKVVGPTSSSGQVILRLDISTDDGTTWPDNGLGIQVAAISFTAAATKRVGFEL